MNVLGRYQILEQLGVGSMGTVYRARDARLDRDVALKTIRTSGEVEPEIRERFYREARACARLQHENIVHVYDVGEEEKIAFIAMELLHGEDLRKTIEKRREMPLPNKLGFMIQVCEALHHAHSRGVIHRDIKPSNLFLTDDGRAKVMDFGIARLPSSRLTVAGNILGTPNYMAPEQMLGKPTDARTDLFSAALVFFELLVYVHPFHASVIPKRIVEGDPDSLFDHMPNLPVLLEKVLARALSKNPEDRYPSGEDLAGDLRAVLDAVKLNASPSTGLPSERALPKDDAPADGDMTLLRPVPEGEDTAEWRLSEVLRLIPEFEDALERKDKDAAKKALAELKAIAVADKRFLEAAESSQTAYEKVWGAETGSRAPVTVGQATAATAVEDSGRAGAPATGIATPPGAAAQSGRGTLAGTRSTGRITTVPIVPGTQPKKVEPRKPASDRSKALYTAGIILLGVILAGWILSQFMKPVSLKEAIASARVVAARAPVYAAQGGTSGEVVAVPRGEPIRILELPRDRAAQFIWVQPVVEGKTYAPGYARLADLSDWSEWSFNNGNGPAQLARTMAPRPDASDEELKNYAAKLRNFADRVASVGADQQVQQQVAEIDRILADRHPPAAVGETGLPIAPESGTGVAAAPQTPGTPQGGSPQPPAAQPGVASAPGATPATPGAEETVESLLRRAERAKRDLQLDRAIGLVNRALKKEPDNAAAQRLMTDLKTLKELDEATR